MSFDYTQYGSPELSEEQRALVCKRLDILNDECQLRQLQPRAEDAISQAIRAHALTERETYRDALCSALRMIDAQKAEIARLEAIITGYAPTLPGAQIGSPMAEIQRRIIDAGLDDASYTGEEPLAVAWS